MVLSKMVSQYFLFELREAGIVPVGWKRPSGCSKQRPSRAPPRAKSAGCLLDRSAIHFGQGTAFGRPQEVWGRLVGAGARWPPSSWRRVARRCRSGWPNTAARRFPCASSTRATAHFASPPCGRGSGRHGLLRLRRPAGHVWPSGSRLPAPHAAERPSGTGLALLAARMPRPDAWHRPGDWCCAAGPRAQQPS